MYAIQIYPLLPTIMINSSSKYMELNPTYYYSVGRCEMLAKCWRTPDRQVRTNGPHATHDLYLVRRRSPYFTNQWLNKIPNSILSFNSTNVSSTNRLTRSHIEIHRQRNTLRAMLAAEHAKRPVSVESTTIPAYYPNLYPGSSRSLWRLNLNQR